ncbi:hypothetical protein EYF80_013731 [Liparis tanakae]|uniref:Uncharacterized protein n=1 Tax=Liparis tanakae TaxID=230148 RepID=A0A4Z2IDA3_9TELE|nr:hypothetical protein EYF80_013731 [Liparis tanakae]
MEEDESVVEAEQTNLPPSPHLGAGVVLRLRAGSGASVLRLPPTDMSAPPPLRQTEELPSVELLTPRSAPNYPAGSADRVPPENSHQSSPVPSLLSCSPPARLHRNTFFFTIRPSFPPPGSRAKARAWENALPESKLQSRRILTSTHPVTDKCELEPRPPVDTKRKNQSEMERGCLALLKGAKLN